MTSGQFSKTVHNFSFILLLTIGTYGQTKFLTNSDIFGRRVYKKQRAI